MSTWDGIVHRNSNKLMIASVAVCLFCVDTNYSDVLGPIRCTVNFLVDHSLFLVKPKLC